MRATDIKKVPLEINPVLKILFTCKSYSILACFSCQFKISTLLDSRLNDS